MRHLVFNLFGKPYQHDFLQSVVRRFCRVYNSRRLKDRIIYVESAVYLGIYASVVNNFRNIVWKYGDKPY